MEKRLTTLGLDLGIASIGWCLYEDDQSGNPRKIVDIGSFVFDQIEDQKTGKTENIARREKRSMRRQRRRRVRRLEDGRKLFQDSLGVDFQKLSAKSYEYQSPFELKVKGLRERLSKEELCLALYHYLKYRGYKSNRKIDTKDKKKEDGKMLSSIATLRDEINSCEIKGQKAYVTEILLNKFNSKDSKERRLHNSESEYLLTVSRDMYLDEINALLNKQISFGLINEDFKERFIALFQRQRDYSEGPDINSDSKFRIDMNKIIGTCSFDNEPRAPKDSISAKRFVLLSSLANLRFKTNESENYDSLSPEQIEELENVILAKQETKYADIFKKINVIPFRIAGLSLTRKEYAEVIRKFKEEENISDDDYSLTSEQSEKLSKKMSQKLLSKVFFKNSSFYPSLKKEVSKLKEGKRYDNDAFYDDVAEILIRNKTDSRIAEECKKKGYSEDVISCIQNCKDCKDTINLSIPLCRQLIPLLKEGKNYKDAMARLGLSHSEKERAEEIGNLPEINDALSKMGVRLTNPVVKHTLVQMRKIINAIIKEYGKPNYFSVELTRELKNSFADRQAIRSAQLDNQEANIREKTEILEKFGEQFSSITSIRKDALLRYRLFKQQGGVSPYTNKPIREDRIFDDNEYQIDHILPYSRSFNDSMSNKVLVETKSNQDKRNETPMEWLGGSERIQPLYAYLKSHYLPASKVRNLLAREISDDFVSKDLNDTSYLSRLAKQLIEFYLLPEGKNCQTVPGQLTEKLRQFWDLSGRTHSFYSSHDKQLYKAKLLEDYKFESITVDDKGKIDVHFKYMTNDFSFSFEPKKKKGDKSLSRDDEHYNRELTTFKSLFSFYLNRFLTCSCKGRDINKLYEAINFESNNDRDSERKEAGLFVLGLMLNEIQKDISAKNRDNDLHHALDAAVIGLVNPTIIKRFSEFHKSKETEIDYQTGEIKISIPYPYPEFRDEVLTRIYERDEERLIDYLNKLDNYKESPATRKNVHVLWPVRLPKKDVVGAISQDTIYGTNKLDGSLTHKISVSELDDKKIEKIVGKENGNKAVYEACKSWLAANKPTQYPILAKKGTPIKYAKIVVADSPKGKVDLSEGKFAENSLVIRVDVYKKKGNDKTIYMVPIYYYQIFQEKRFKNNYNIDYTIMWKQGNDGKLIIKGRELDEHYKKVCTMPLRSLIEIQKGKDKCFAYSGGCSSGMFEIYSLLGDQQDLISAHLFDTIRNQCQITISTIASIKVHSITVLGKIY